MDGLHILFAAPFVSLGVSGSFASVRRKRDPLHIYWALFAAAVVFFSLDKAFAGHLGPLNSVVAILGSSTCGVSWLLARALFRPASLRLRWPLYVVAALYGSAAIFEFLPAAADGVTASLIGMLDKARSLLSSSVLVLTFLEPFRGYGAGLSGREKRFRIGFFAGYAALVASAVLLDVASLPGLGAVWQDAVKVICAILALIGFSFAVAFRSAFPFAVTPAPKKVAVTADHAHLVARIKQRIEDPEVYGRPDLKVADLARMVGEPEYKVSQSIGQMGFANFNRLINTHRLRKAQAMLADPSCAHLPILTVAMDCGFGSIGPFNRAFKAQTGQTPKQYRAEKRLPQCMAP